jgi:plastocyanin
VVIKKLQRGGSQAPQRAGAPAVGLPPLLPSQLPPEPPKTPAITATDAVRIEKRAFTPLAIAVKSGTLVSWTNYDLSPHTVTGSGFNSGALSQGAVWSQHFTKPGRYEYRCSIHPTMRGVVEVK